MKAARRGSLVGVAVCATSALLGGGCRKEPASHAPVKIAAASDLALAFPEVAKLFQADGAAAPVFSFGSTGQLAKQIAEGAPFDLFAGADVSFVDQVVKAGVCDGATKGQYARGRVGVWTPAAVVAPSKLADLIDGRFRKIALANPEHAPYGRAAKQALQTAGLWEKLVDRVVYAENIQQSLKFAQSGNVDAAVVALSLGGVSRGGSFLLLDADLHPPIDQVLVVCLRGQNPAGARAFAALVGSPAGRAVMKSFGFLMPDEMTAAAVPTTTPSGSTTK